MNLADELKRLRALSKMTQRDIAERLGVAQSYYAQLETGVRTGLTAEMLYKLSEALGVDSGHWRPFIMPPVVPTPEVES